MFEAFITSVLLMVAPPNTYCQQELDAMNVCEEAVAIYSHGVAPQELDQLLWDQGWDPEQEFTHHGCLYMEDGGVTLDEGAAD